jgi:hypothetical protein
VCVAKRQFSVSPWCIRSKDGQYKIQFSFLEVSHSCSTSNFLRFQRPTERGERRERRERERAGTDRQRERERNRKKIESDKELRREREGEERERKEGREERTPVASRTPSES